MKEKIEQRIKILERSIFNIENLENNLSEIENTMYNTIYTCAEDEIQFLKELLKEFNEPLLESKKSSIKEPNNDNQSFDEWRALTLAKNPMRY